MRNLTLLLLISVACHGQPKEFDQSQVVEDINYLRSELETFHPGLYRYTSQSQMDQFFEEAAISSNGLEGKELYARVTFLLSQVKCGHTRTSMPENLRNTHQSNNRFLPFFIQLLGAAPYVTASLDESLPVGSKIISINGKSYAEIEQTIFRHLPSDGFIESGKRRMMNWLFPFYYQLYVDGQNDEVSIEFYSNAGERHQVTLNRVRNTEIEALSGYQNREAELRLAHKDNHSYMRISTFGQQSLSNAGFKYERFLKQSFKELKSRGVKNLVLDLRGNGGGRDNFGALLVSYLLPREFGYFENIEVTPNYSGYGDVVERNNQYYVTSHRGLNKWQPQPDVFEGNLYVLIDGGSFSTCADVATVLHHNRRGLFLGAETGGGYDGNTSGNTKSITLPNSGIRVFVPLWMYTTANLGHDFPGRGVIPDHLIVPTWEQYSNKEDVVMKRALELIQE